MQQRYVKTFFLVLLASIATYSLVGFLVAPHLLRYWIEHSISTPPSQRLVVERVFVNPYTLFISLTNLALVNKRNDVVISVGRFEMHARILERLKSGRRGGDAELRDLQANDPSTGQTILSIPNFSITGLAINASSGSVSIGTGHLMNPELRILRDADGDLHLPSWLHAVEEASYAAAVRYERLEINSGRLLFNDHSIAPSLQLQVSDVAGHVARRQAAAGRSLAIEFEGRFGDYGSAELAAEWLQSIGQETATIDLLLRRINVATVSPYFKQVAGCGIDGGTGDLTLHYERRDTNVRIDNRLVIDRLTLAERTPTDSGTGLPLDLAVALLTDERERIDISIAVSRKGVDAGFNVADAVPDSLIDYIERAAATPFDMLANLVGHDAQDLSNLAFPPGSAEITPATTEKILLLAQALEQRPMLGLRAYPAYDADVDRDALAARQVRLHVNLATSAGSPGMAAQTPLDFDDPKVQTILDEFAAARLPESQWNAISSRFDDTGRTDYRAVYDALIANEKVSPLALQRLARFRVQSAVGALVANGAEERRILTADTVEAMSSGRDAIAVRLEALPRTRE